jgi:hypothetical protein
MGDDYRKLFPGEPVGRVLSANRINMMVDAAKFARVLHRVEQGARGLVFEDALPALTVYATSRSVTIGNVVGLMIPQGWKGPVIEEWIADAQRRPIFRASAPVRGKPFGIAVDPSNGIEDAFRVAVAGLAFTFVKKPADDVDLYEYADVIDDEFQGLLSVPHGPARVIASRPHSGHWHLALVQLDARDQQEIVLVTSSGGTSEGSGGAGNLQHGYVQRFNGTMWSNVQECYVIDLND